jgi:hypothetical protein
MITGESPNSRVAQFGVASAIDKRIQFQFDTRGNLYLTSIL